MGQTKKTQILNSRINGVRKTDWCVKGRYMPNKNRMGPAEPQKKQKSCRPKTVRLRSSKPKQSQTRAAEGENRLHWHMTRGLTAHGDGPLSKNALFNHTCHVKPQKAALWKAPRCSVTIT